MVGSTWVGNAASHRCLGIHAIPVIRPQSAGYPAHSDTGAALPRVLAPFGTERSSGPDQRGRSASLHDWHSSGTSVAAGITPVQECRQWMPALRQPARQVGEDRQIGAGVGGFGVLSPVAVFRRAARRAGQGGSLWQGKKRSMGISFEGTNGLEGASDQVFNGLRGAVAKSDADDFGRRTPHEAQVMKILILGDDRVVVLHRAIPNLRIRSAGHPMETDMGTVRKTVGKTLDQRGGEILIKEQFHAALGVWRRRSRLAANARVALMSSSSRSGKSFRI